MKPTVRFKNSGSIVVGVGAFVETEEHPRIYSQNADGAMLPIWVLTSPVVKKNEDGSFETENTKYVPQGEAK